MSIDTFSNALPSLRPHTNLPVPLIYAHLSYLLSQYSTGLSLPITLDSLSALSSPKQEASFIEASIITTHATPTVHLLKSATQTLSLYPPSTLPSLKPGTTLLLPKLTTSEDALSLSRKLFLSHNVTNAILPTQNLAIRLPFPHNLPQPEQSYTLLSIWQNRDLTPPAVYAMLLSTNPDEPSLVLVDQLPDSPSVVFMLSPARVGLTRMLPTPCNLLVTTPAVDPTENSFVLHDTPMSTFYYQPLPKPVTKKRRRPSLKGDVLHTPKELVDLTQSELERPITVHARVESVKHECGAIVITSDGIFITIPDGSFERGDELLLNGVLYQDGWIAQQVTNISTMQGVLHCPFVRKIVSIKEAVRLCRNAVYRTAHIKVCLNGAVLQGEGIKLSVVDSVSATRECGAVLMKERGYDQVFGNSQEHLSKYGKDILMQRVRKIQRVVWLATVTCGVADLPVLSACLREG